MGKIRLLITVVVAGMLLLAAHVVQSMPATARSRADTAIDFGFARPVAIPGQTLPAGTYEFRIVRTFGDRDIVQIASADGAKVYGTLVTIPMKRTMTTGPAVVTFAERVGTSPEAIRAFFLSGRLWGEGLVYPKSQAAALAKANGAAVPAMSVDLTADLVRRNTAPVATALEDARLSAIDAKGRDVDVTEAVRVRPAVIS